MPPCFGVSELAFDLHSLKNRLGGVVVSVLATGPQGRGFEPGQGDHFKGRKNPQHTYLRMGRKAGGPTS
jgi:hypothetical protein